MIKSLEEEDIILRPNPWSLDPNDKTEWKVEKIGYVFIRNMDDEETEILHPHDFAWEKKRERKNA